MNRSAGFVKFSNQRQISHWALFLLCNGLEVPLARLFRRNLFSDTLLFDDRFANLVTIFGDLTPAMAVQNQHALKALFSLDSQLTVNQIQIPASLHNLAFFMTYWVLILEGFLALLFCVTRTTNDLSVAQWITAAISIYHLYQRAGSWFWLGVDNYGHCPMPPHRPLLVTALSWALFLPFWIYLTPWSAIAQGSLGIYLPFSS